MTKSRWINPPIVYEETKPNSHNITNITASVVNIALFTSPTDIKSPGRSYLFVMLQPKHAYLKSS